MAELNEVLPYVDRGWPVFVLSASKTPVANCERCRTEHTTPAEKEACECLTCHGFYAATRDRERIAEMLARHPDGLVAIRTGAPSGTVVIDVDPPDGFRTLALLDRAALLPGTLMQMTGSGGLHLVYAHPGVPIASGARKLGPGVDVKADGAYIVVAPSAHPRTGHRYQWSGDGRIDHPLAPLHRTLARRLGPAPPVSAPPAADRLLARCAHSSRATARRPGQAGPYGRLRGLVSTVLAAQPGERNSTLYWAACRAGEMVAAGELDELTAFEVLRETGLAIGLSPAEIGTGPGRGTVGSGLASGRRGVAL